MRIELARFISRFDAGEYWAAHEELEPAWLRDRVPELQGLIHLAAALLHAERGNRNGARRKARSGLDLLGDTPAVDGLALQPIRDAARDLIASIESTSGSDQPPAPVVPRLRSLLDDPAEVPELQPHDLPYRVRRYADGYRIGRDPAVRDRS